eukprot:m.287327 g.287327  ORF g.287327 m.287327 type:complete len:585 (-) comp15788_c0_seq1:283-2037(-)
MDADEFELKGDISLSNPFAARNRAQLLEKQRKEQEIIAKKLALAREAERQAAAERKEQARLAREDALLKRRALENQRFEEARKREEAEKERRAEEERLYAQRLEEQKLKAQQLALQKQKQAEQQALEDEQRRLEELRLEKEQIKQSQLERRMQQIKEAEEHAEKLAAFTEATKVLEDQLIQARMLGLIDEKKCTNWKRILWNQDAVAERQHIAYQLKDMLRVHVQRERMEKEAREAERLKELREQELAREQERQTQLNEQQRQQEARQKIDKFQQDVSTAQDLYAKPYNPNDITTLLLDPDTEDEGCLQLERYFCEVLGIEGETTFRRYLDTSFPSFSVDTVVPSLARILRRRPAQVNALSCLGMLSFSGHKNTYRAVRELNAIPDTVDEWTGHMAACRIVAEYRGWYASHEGSGAQTPFRSSAERMAVNVPEEMSQILQVQVRAGIQKCNEILSLHPVGPDFGRDLDIVTSKLLGILMMAPMHKRKLEQAQAEQELEKERRLAELTKESALSDLQKAQVAAQQKIEALRIVLRNSREEARVNHHDIAANEETLARLEPEVSKLQKLDEDLSKLEVLMKAYEAK